jgi:hypothetical protein
MRWTPTHRVTFTPNREEAQSFEVMAFDLGHDHAGPGRYGLYQQVEWGEAALPDWTMDAEGRVWFQGEALPGDWSATIEGLWGQ